MTPEHRAQLAKSLRNNQLLPIIFEERRQEIAGDWLSEEKAERRESLWAEARALENLKDYLYAAIAAGNSGDGADTD